MLLIGRVKWIGPLIADCTNASPQFVHLSLQSWIPHYLWKHVNPSLASLGQIMSIKKIKQRLMKLRLDSNIIM